MTDDGSLGDVELLGQLGERDPSGLRDGVDDTKCASQRSDLVLRLRVSHYGTCFRIVLGPYLNPPAASIAQPRPRRVEPIASHVRLIADAMRPACRLSTVIMAAAARRWWPTLGAASGQMGKSWAAQLIVSGGAAASPERRPPANEGYPAHRSQPAPTGSRSFARTRSPVRSRHAPCGRGCAPRD